MPGAAQPKPSSAPSREAVWRRYREVRAESERLAAPLATEDYVIQAMPDVSPPKWHLAHITWFFEHFIARALRARVSRPSIPGTAISSTRTTRPSGRSSRASRAVCSRVPTVEEVFRYRAHVDRVIGDVIDAAGDQDWDEVARRIELGLHHEQQHQELLLTDSSTISRSTRCSRRTGRRSSDRRRRRRGRVGWIDFDAGIRQIGYEGRELCVRQRAAASPRLSRAVPARRPPGHERRVPRVHRRRRLLAARPLAVGRLDDGQGTRLGSAALLGADGRRVVADDARRHAPRRPGASRCAT